MSWRDAAPIVTGVVATSRALNVSSAAADVRAVCTKHKLTISAIETLLSGGTRVVMRNGDDAANLRRILKTKIINGSVNRAAWAAHRG